MREDQFTEKSPGRLERIPDEEGGIAFVPDALPPDFSLDLDTLRLMSSAERAIGRLEEAVYGLPNRELIVSTFVRSEAVASSRIEGTITSLEELTLLNAGAKELADPDSAREADNYSEALKLGIRLLDEIPPSLRLILQMHGRLMQAVRGADQSTGEFRQKQNFIVDGPTSRPSLARYVPPPVPRMREGLDLFERYINGSLDYPPLIELALIHYQFEAIHPFGDGNGRVGRLLVALLMHHWKILRHPVLRISPYFENHKSEYVDSLLSVSQKGDWTTWIRLFLTAVAVQSRDSATRACRLFHLREKYRASVLRISSSNAALSIVDGLFELAAISAPLASHKYNMTQRTATRAIQLLVDEGVLTEVTGHSCNRLYFAAEIFDALHTPIEADEE